MVKVVLITGHYGTGKTDLANNLNQKHGFDFIRSSRELKVSSYIASDAPVERKALQDLGAKRDEETDGRWLFDITKERCQTLQKEQVRIVVDHIRNRTQLQHFRSMADWTVYHVHLYASREYLERKFENENSGESISYEQADPIESETDIERFKRDADVRINVERCDAEDIYIRVAARLGLLPEKDKALVDVLIGGQYGSEGKGHIAASIARHYDLVVRVGGPNAGHTVSSSSGTYTYHHLPSGTKDFKAKVLLGPGMTIDKGKLLKEITDCSIGPDRLCIDPQAILITEGDKAREEEMRRQIASTASGSGAASARRILNRLKDSPILAGQDSELAEFTKRRPNFAGDAISEYERCFADNKRILLEGTQGSGLSIFHGDYPYVTSRDTNVAGCLAEAGLPPKRVRRIIMVIRTTPIRVGDPDGVGFTSGGIKNPTTFEEIATKSGLDPVQTKNNEKTSTTKRDRRVGWFDWELFRRSCILNTPTDIALTFVDYMDAENKNARRFEQLTQDTIKFIEELERVAQAPVSIINTRFPNIDDDRDIRSIIDRRSWR